MSDELMESPVRYPDAVLIPDDWKGDDPHPMRQAHAFLGHAERILGVDRSKGQQAYFRKAEGGHRYATTSSADTLFFPSNHRRHGQSRYRWEKQDDGSVHGFYVDDEAREVIHGKA